MTSLDGIFDQIESIEENSESEPKTYISIYLTSPPDQKDIYEVANISVYIEGLNGIDSLDIGSWIKQSELKELKNKNRNIKFIYGVV